ncbi:MAG: hexokinase [Treponema sp.]|nr:hexokinase [Treponema sp.]
MGSSFDRGELSEFAGFYGFHYRGVDGRALVADILGDMERGLDGRPSSLPMIPAYLGLSRTAPVGGSVLALDAGGTNLRAARVGFDPSGRARIAESRLSVMPGSSGRVSADRFFDLIAEAALAVLGSGPEPSGIGFTFSYHMDIRKDADGILRAFSKEIDAPEVVGRAIGAGLRRALADRGYRYEGPIVLLNDTAATLLSGMTSGGGADFQAAGFPPVIGFILGTGFNTAYPETSVGKIGFESPGSPQIVVCESGAFAVGHRGVLDLEFDAGTRAPGLYSLEKTCSGAYLGPLIFHILKRAVRDGVVRFARSDEFLAMESPDSRTVSDFLREPSSGSLPGSLFSPEEAPAAAACRYLASIVVERGALFSAAVLAATARRVDSRLPGLISPLNPVRIAVEGSTYLAFTGMRDCLDARLRVLLAEDCPLPFRIFPVEQASLLGAAVAAASGPAPKPAG